MEKMEQIHIKMPADLHKRVKVRAAKDETSITAIVVEALERYLARKET